jgi:hypothetical protein
MLASNKPTSNNGEHNPPSHSTTDTPQPIHTTYYRQI